MGAERNNRRCFRCGPLAHWSIHRMCAKMKLCSLRQGTSETRVSCGEYSLDVGGVERLRDHANHSCVLSLLGPTSSKYTGAPNFHGADRSRCLCSSSPRRNAQRQTDRDTSRWEADRNKPMAYQCKQEQRPVKEVKAEPGPAVPGRIRGLKGARLASFAKGCGRTRCAPTSPTSSGVRPPSPGAKAAKAGTQRGHGVHGVRSLIGSRARIGAALQLGRPRRQKSNIKSTTCMTGKARR